jgi:hypothetical protein
MSPPAAEPVTSVVLPPASGPQFVLGFEFLKAEMGPIMGDAVELEHGNPDNCDTQQLTTTGLAYWRCSTNMMSFVAFPDGLIHWAWMPPGLFEWAGPDVDPPEGTPIVAKTSVIGDGRLTTSCLAVAQVPSEMCSVGDSLAAVGIIKAVGETSTFRFSVPSTGLNVTANLVDLPADYDLYVADASGNIIGQSAAEGTTPEHVDLNLDGGTYYVYVHADPGRPVDPQDPYRLEVSVSSVVATDRSANTPTAAPPDAGASPVVQEVGTEPADAGH